jgi:hypothetical protein
MKCLFPVIIAMVTAFPGVSWGMECIKFEDMSVKILNQVDDIVNLEWKARVINKCNKVMPVKVEIQFADNKGKRLESGFEPLDPMDPSEVREIQGQQGLSSETYYKIGTYYFKAIELPNEVQ